MPAGSVLQSFTPFCTSLGYAEGGKLSWGIPLGCCVSLYVAYADEVFGNLHGVEGCALAYLVACEP